MCPTAADPPQGDLDLDGTGDVCDSDDDGDDVADGDAVPRSDLDVAIWTSLVTMPANPFYVANFQSLQAALALLVLKWKASDDAERAGQADARSFIWRAAYYDLVLLVVLLTKGHATAMKDAVKVMHLYGETLPEYLKEFS